MKRMLSTIVAALVAVSFAGIVCAAEPAQEAAPALPAGHPTIKQAAPKGVKKHKKHKKAKKEEVKPAEAPAAPAAPAAK